MSARDQNYPAQNCKSAHDAYGDLSDRALGHTPQADAGYMKPSGCDRETHRIRNEGSSYSFRPMSVAMKKRK
jgi:hypothetical protein